MARKAALKASTKLPVGVTNEDGARLVRIDPALLRVMSGYNVRKPFDPNEPEDKELVASVIANGVREPLKVRQVGGEYFIIAGHRRYSAVLLANATEKRIRSVPAIIVTADEGREDLTIDLLRSNQYRALSLPEKGAIFQRLRDYGWSDVDIAAKAGVTDRTVRDACKLARTDARIRAWIKQGFIAPTLALSTVQTSGPDAPEVIGEAVANAKAKGRTKATEADIVAAQAKRGGATVTARTAKGAKAGASKVHAGTRQPSGNGGAAGKTGGEAAPTAAKNGEFCPEYSMLHGPFRVGGEDKMELHDRAGKLVGYGNSAGLAQQLCAMLNWAWSHTAKGKADEAAEAAKAATRAAQAVANHPASASAPAKPEAAAPAKGKAKPAARKASKRAA